MEKQRIIDEIARIARENGGKAPGKKAFYHETGISESDWRPLLWQRWSDAVIEAGFSPNQFNPKLDDSIVLEHYIALIREFGRVPTIDELRLRTHHDSTLPTVRTFTRRGNKQNLVQQVTAYCAGKELYQDVLEICRAYIVASRITTSPMLLLDPTSKPKSKPKVGYVYLMQSGKHYKIGRTDFTVGHREYQLGIILPIRPKTLHYIETDDPIGVEAYWHNRFRDKRREGHGSRKGEWFDLTADDIAAFKRWKRIV